MSKSLLKKAFGLYSDDLYTSGKNDTNLKTFTYKQGMKKNAAKLRKDKASRQQDRKKALKDKKVKSILEEHEKKKQVDHTQSNIMYLKALGASSLPSEEAQSIFKHNRGKLSKNNALPEKEDIKEETVFTDQDFEDFGKDLHLT